MRNFGDLMVEAMEPCDPSVSEEGFLRVQWKANFPWQLDGTTTDGRPIWKARLRSGGTVYRYGNALKAV